MGGTVCIELKHIVAHADVNGICHVSEKTTKFIPLNFLVIWNSQELPLAVSMVSFRLSRLEQ